MKVTVFEAASTVGGRARAVDKDGRRFDNGQHLLLGAYQHALAMISSLHANSNDVMLRQPLALCTAPGHIAALRLRAPDLPAPLHLLVAIATARGLSVSDKFSTIRWAARNIGSTSVSKDGDSTVAELIATQPESARHLLWEPLCIAALNTPPSTASARVFLNVLRLAFTGDQRASDLLIPRVDLSHLLPTPALAEVVRLGGSVRTAAPVLAINATEGAVSLALRNESHCFQNVVIATGPQHVARLLEKIHGQEGVSKTLSALQFEPITTLYFEFAWVSPGVDEGMLMLDGDPGQWLFWQRLASGQWRASVVISAHHRGQDEADLHRDALSQLRRSYRLPDPGWHIIITEKRATYACTPAQVRSLVSLPKSCERLYFAGDWCCPELPATLEAAVLSGINAAQLIVTKLLKR
jgi:hydroxysqualene dehydroxylase